MITFEQDDTEYRFPSDLVIGVHHADTEKVRTFCKRALACLDLYVVATVELVRIPKPLDEYTCKDQQYLRNLKELMERYTRGLCARKTFITWNGNEHGYQFWKSRWADSHD